MDSFISKRELGTVDGFELVAYELHDSDSSPFDADCYSDEDIEAWRNDEWYFAGVCVQAQIDGEVFGEASIWGCDTGEYWERVNPGNPDILDDAPGFGTAALLDDGTVGPMKVETTFAHGYGSDLVAEALFDAKRWAA